MITPLVTEDFYCGHRFDNSIFIFEPPEYRTSHSNVAYKKIAPLLEHRIDNMIENTSINGVYRYFVKYIPVFILNIFSIKLALSQSIDLKYKQQKIPNNRVRIYVRDFIINRLDLMIYNMKCK